MSKLIVEDYLTEIRDEKIKQLAGIALDLRYWSSYTEGTDVNALRKELAEEREKLVQNPNGSIQKDERDLDKINALNEQIGIFEKAEEKIGELKLMYKQIEQYLEFVSNPDNDTLDKLNNIASK